MHSCSPLGSKNVVKEKIGKSGDMKLPTGITITWSASSIPSSLHRNHPNSRFHLDSCFFFLSIPKHKHGQPTWMDSTSLSCSHKCNLSLIARIFHPRSGQWAHIAYLQPKCGQLEMHFVTRPKLDAAGYELELGDDGHSYLGKIKCGTFLSLKFRLILLCRVIGRPATPRAICLSKQKRKWN